MSVRGFATQEERDRAEYDAWVAAELDRVHTYGEAGNGFDVWDSSRLRAAGKVAPDEAEAYAGPWRHVRPYVTQEFRWWVEAYGQPRMTFAEWQARARAERRAEAMRQRDYLDSADYCLHELEMLRELMARRDELIATARERGATWGAITDASGLSRMQAHTVTKAWRAAHADAAPVEAAEAAGALALTVPDAGEAVPGDDESRDRVPALVGGGEWYEVAPGVWEELL